jgi:hypothetical protein
MSLVYAPLVSVCICANKKAASDAVMPWNVRDVAPNTQSFWRLGFTHVAVNATQYRCPATRGVVTKSTGEASLPW